MRLLFLTALHLIGAVLSAQPLTWVWAWGASSAGNEYAYASWAPSGVLHVLGNYENTVDANGTLLTSSGEGDLFVQQLDPLDGSVQWTAEAHHTHDLSIYDGAYRSTGELVVGGSVAHNGDAAQFGSWTIPGQPSGVQAFIAGLSPTGTWNWVSAISGTPSSGGYLVEVDASDDIYVSCFIGSVEVKRFTGPGTPVWSATATSTGSSVDAYAMDVLPGGDLVITGRCYGTSTFGTLSTTVSGIYYDAYVARLSSAGTWLWVEQGGGSHWDKGFGVCANAAGDVYITGTYRNTANFGPFQLTASGPNDLWIAKLNGSGQWQWVESAASTAYMDVYAFDLSVDQDRLVATGSYAFDAPTLGGFTLPTPTSNDVFVAEFDTTGSILSAIGFGSGAGDQGFSAVYDPAGSIYAAGNFGASMLLGNDTLIGVAPNDLWVGRLDPSLGTPVAPNVSASAMLTPIMVVEGIVLRNAYGLVGDLLLLDALGRTCSRVQVNGADGQHIPLRDRMPGLVLWNFRGAHGTVQTGRLVRTGDE